jgi:tRNA(adenine34) deaminase
MPAGQSGASNQDESYMREALAEAAAAALAGEVPIGAVVVQAGRITGRGANRTRRDSIVAAHAELVALGDAQRRAGDFRIDGSTVYVTVEPCLMCLGAMQQSRVGRVVYGAPEPKFGALGSRFELTGHPLMAGMEFRGGVLASEAAELLGDFFRQLR